MVLEETKGAEGMLTNAMTRLCGEIVALRKMRGRIIGSPGCWTVPGSFIKSIGNFGKGLPVSSACLR
jgi:hypothetical protein